jgi:hypothetical protein
MSDKEPRSRSARVHVMPPAYDFKHPEFDERSCHIWLKHGPDHHDNDLDCGTHCMFCEGGLSLCIVCGGFEGTLSTQCAGVKLTEEQLDLVYAQMLDFNQNRWWSVKVGDDDE